MRLSHIFGTTLPEPSGETQGVTLDVLTGIVAGLAIVLAILILSSTVRHASANSGPAPILADTQG